MLKDSLEEAISEISFYFETTIYLKPEQKIGITNDGEDKFVFHRGNDKRISLKSIVKFFSTNIRDALDFRDSEAESYIIKYNNKDITDNLISFIISDFIDRQKKMDGDIEKLTNDFIDEELSKNTKMMENKYYTPSEKELLEAIINNQNVFTRDYKNNEVTNEINFNLNSVIDNINSFMLMNNYHSEYGHYFNPELYAIKYLDKQDIEELGWDMVKEYNESYKFKLNQHSLIYSKDKFMVITFKPEGYTSHNLFRGIVKNKSELKWLLQRLDII